MGNRWVLEIDRVRDPQGRLVLAARGEIDLMSSPLLSDAIERARRSGQTLVLDLSEVSFIDSTGLHVLITMARAAERDGWALEVRPEVRADVATMLRTAGCWDVLPWERSVPPRIVDEG